MPKQSSSNNKTTTKTRKGFVVRRVDEYARNQEMEAVGEYVEYLQNRRRLLSTNFLAGMMRGMGFAVGFSILGTLVIMLVQRLALANLPGIGDFFAEIVRIVQMRLY